MSLDFSIDYSRDFVFTKGILIYNNSEHPRVYEPLYRTCKKYLCVAECYHPIPVSVPLYGGFFWDSLVRQNRLAVSPRTRSMLPCAEECPQTSSFVDR